jgi:hypothetical protein
MTGFDSLAALSGKRTRWLPVRYFYGRLIIVLFSMARAKWFSNSLAAAINRIDRVRVSSTALTLHS